MSAPALSPGLTTAASPGQTLRQLVAEAMTRERRLTLYALALFALAIPMALAWGIDERVVRGANVWIKPIKFALSIGLLALTTAWFIGHLVPAKRRGPAIDRIVWLLIGTGSFELAYITLQAALGQGSHFNVGDAFHGTMYTLMGIGAIGLTATQPMLAWQLHRHPDDVRPSAYRLAVKLGLVLTFAFGAGIGLLLSGIQPPQGGAAVPLLGWQLAGGDLRPAHFWGIHAGQLLPAVGLLVAARAEAQARARVWIATAGHALLFAVLVAWGLKAWA
jgi:hypothetical protein